MTTPRPECSGDCFVFAEGQPWSFTLHEKSCPAYCVCPTFHGKRGLRRMHVETCGWYQEPEKPKPGAVKGVRPKFMVIDELE